MWGYIIAAIGLYLLLKNNPKPIERFISRLNEFKEYANVPEIQGAFAAAVAGIDAAAKDNRWTFDEIITVYCLLRNLERKVNEYKKGAK